MKVCTTCSKEKPETEYYSDKREASGLHARCKTCMQLASRKWKEKNKGRVSEYAEKYRKGNRDKLATQKQDWYYKNREHCLAYARSREVLKTRQKHLLEEFDEFVLAEAYHLAGLRFDSTGIKWHVDHIVPLRGRNVCGLHVAINLQVIPAILNLKKHNKFEEEDMARLGLTVIK